MEVANRVRQLLRHGGLVGLLKGICRFIYWQGGIRTTRYSIEYKLYGDPVTETIDDVSAHFAARSPNEYARVRSLYGERPIITQLLSEVDPNDVFYDIGANIGIYSIFASKKLNTGNSIAFEPHRINASRIQRNADLNDVKIGIHQVALSNETRTGKLSTSDSESDKISGTHSLAKGEDSETISVEMIEGDKLIKQNDIKLPTVMKIDVEGAEQLVLEGLSDTLGSGQCHTIYCEVHPNKLSKFGGSEKELRKLLQKNGFSLKMVENRSPEYFLKASR